MSQRNQFGTCCNDMSDALTLPDRKFIFVQEGTGVLYMTVGAMRTEIGTGLFDQAVLFCPFCGTQLQTREAIKDATAPRH